MIGRTHFIRRGALAMVALGLVGCVSLAPDYQRGPLPVRDQWIGAAAADTSPDRDAAALGWQAFIQDERLRQIVTAALAHNRDLQAAAHNLAAARAVYRQGRAGLFPSLGVAGSDTREWQSDNQMDTEGITRSSRVGLSVSYEMDLFGRIRNQSQAGLERYLATAEGTRALRISLIAEVAQAYLTLCFRQGPAGPGRKHPGYRPARNGTERCPFSAGHGHPPGLSGAGSPCSSRPGWTWPATAANRPRTGTRWNCW